MVTQIDENGHRKNEVPLWVAKELVESGKYEWKVGNIFQKRRELLAGLCRKCNSPVTVRERDRYNAPESPLLCMRCSRMIEDSEYEKLGGVL